MLPGGGAPATLAAAFRAAIADGRGFVMHFDLVDDILERSEDRIVAVKQVSLAEEYLQDHFPRFPVLPGVMMLEVMVQAARRLLEPRHADRLVLGEVKALKYGAMVRPGESLEVEVVLRKDLGDGRYECKGAGRIRRPHGKNSDTGETAVAGRFTMRPLIVD